MMLYNDDGSTNKHTIGWLIFAAALGSMLIGMAPEVKVLVTWSDALTPTFIGIIIHHIGTVIMAFVGGKLIPTHNHESN